MGNIMKKLLLLLLLVPMVNAEVTNLKCDYESTFNPSEMTTKSTGGSVAITVDTTKKTVTAEGLTQEYEDLGNEIWFSIYKDMQIGDSHSWIRRYRLNRVTAVLETDFLTLKFPKGYKDELLDMLNAYEIKNYKLGLVHTATCKKVESLF